MKIRIGLAQIEMTLGDVYGNLQKHLDYIEQAKRADVDLLVFPELSLTGYVLQDLNQQVAAVPSSDNPIFAPLLDASHDMDIVVGFVEEDRRHRFYIAAAYLSQGKTLHVQRKLYLPTYGLFDDARYFALGNDIRAFNTRFGRVGILICEDFWHASPPYLLWLDGADLFIATSASPGRGITGGTDQLATAYWVEHVLQAYAGLFTNYIVHTNRVGIEDGLVFWGGSIVFGPDGQMDVKAPYFEESLTVTELNTRDLRHTRAHLPLLRDERPELTLRTLQRILSEGE